MKFSKFTQYLEKLEETSSRLSLIEILSQLFKETPATEIEKIVYLIQGRIAPFFAPIEIGMAEKSVASSLAIAYGETKEETLRLYQKLGDMGKVTSDLNKKSKIKSQILTVAEAFETL